MVFKEKINHPKINFKYIFFTALLFLQGCMITPGGEQLIKPKPNISTPTLPQNLKFKPDVLHNFRNGKLISKSSVVVFDPNCAVITAHSVDDSSVTDRKYINSTLASNSKAFLSPIDDLALITTNYEYCKKQIENGNVFKNNVETDKILKGATNLKMFTYHAYQYTWGIFVDSEKSLKMADNIIYTGIEPKDRPNSRFVLIPKFSPDLTGLAEQNPAQPGVSGTLCINGNKLVGVFQRTVLVYYTSKKIDQAQNLKEILEIYPELGVLPLELKEKLSTGDLYPSIIKLVNPTTLNNISKKPSF
jgi:hypothetical protein